MFSTTSMHATKVLIKQKLDRYTAHCKDPKNQHPVAHLQEEQCQGITDSDPMEHPRQQKGVFFQACHVVDFDRKAHELWNHCGLAETVFWSFWLVTLKLSQSDSRQFLLAIFGRVTDYTTYLLCPGKMKHSFSAPTWRKEGGTNLAYLQARIRNFLNLITMAGFISSGGVFKEWRYYTLFFMFVHASHVKNTLQSCLAASELILAA